MKIYSFEKAELTTSEVDENGMDHVLFDLFERRVRYSNIADNYITVPNEYSCRIDMISKKLYQSIGYTEETMVMNNIVNPFSVKPNDIIYYTSDYEKLDLLYTKDSNLNSENKYKILNINKSKASSNVASLPPSVNPGLNQMDIDYNKKKITIINKFK